MLKLEQLIGKKIDKYEILEILGEGGYGVTFKAKDDLGGFVAIKVLKTKVGSDWKKEGEKAAKVRQVPQIASVYAVDETTVVIDGKDENIRYIVWEFISGMPLENLFLQKKKISSSTIVDLTQQLCLGIKGMQEAGLEHGDLHSKNIILVPPEIWDPMKHYTVKIVDFGLARSVREKFTHDMEYLKQIVNRCWNLNQEYNGMTLVPDRKFHKLLTELLRRMCDPNPERKLTDPIEVVKRIDQIQRESKDQVAVKSVNLSHPFEYLSVEEMPENSDLVHFLYTDNVAWLQEITDFGTTIISGPRGSGKSMILKNMRLLTKLRSSDFTEDYLHKLKYLGFYVHCQHNLYYPFAGISINYGSNTCDMFMHYLNLLFTSEILESIILLEELDLQKISPISKNDISDFLRENIFQDKEKDSFISLSSTSLLSHCKSLVEKEILFTQKKILRNETLPNRTSVGYLSQFIGMLDNVSDLFKNKQVFFLLDDYSHPKIRFELQESINRLLGYRNERFCFKTTTEKFGFTPKDSDGKSLQLDREFSYIDLGSRYAKAKSKERKNFIKKILEKRLERANIKLSVEDFFGTKPFKGKIASALLADRGKSDDEEETHRTQYSGFDMIYRLCMGDVSTILQLCKEIYIQSLGDTKKITKGVSPQLQNQVIRNFSKRRLNMIKEIPDVGVGLFNLVESFGNISKKYLYEYSKIKESKFYEVLRIELTESTGCLCENAEKLYKSLIREHIFIDGGGSPPWGKGATNVKLILRPIYTPSLRISYSDRYSIKANCNHLENFLTNPKGFEKTGTKFLKQLNSQQKTLTLDQFTVALIPDLEEETDE